MEAGKIMFFTMFLLTFPTSAFSFCLLLPVIDPAFITEPGEFILVWLIMLIGGLVQWFLIVPNLAHGPELTTLNLGSSPAPSISTIENRTEDTPRVTEPTVMKRGAFSASQRPVTPANLKKGSKTRRQRSKPVVPFDRKGRTPLERVIARS